LLKARKNSLGLKAIAKIVGTTKDNYPVIFIFGGFFTFSMFRLVVLVNGYGGWNMVMYMEMVMRAL
jgi:hypothetical protein